MGFFGKVGDSISGGKGRGGLGWKVLDHLAARKEECFQGCQGHPRSVHMDRVTI